MITYWSCRFEVKRRTIKTSQITSVSLREIKLTRWGNLYLVVFDAFENCRAFWMWEFANAMHFYSSLPKCICNWSCANVSVEITIMFYGYCFLKTGHSFWWRKSDEPSAYNWEVLSEIQMPSNWSNWCPFGKCGISAISTILLNFYS